MTRRFIGMPPVGLSATSGKTLTVSNSITIAGTDGTTMTFPSTSATIARTDAANTFVGTQTLNSMANSSDAVQTSVSGAINTVETILFSTAALPANRLVVGSVLHWELFGTCTASAANASSFKIRMGTLGTTSDGLVATVNSPNSATSGTNIPFHVFMDMIVTAVGSGTSGTAVANWTLVNSGSTGIIATASNNGQMTMSGFDTTVASQIISVSYISAASTTTSTFQFGYLSFVNK